jgi:hypothetical protein
MLMMPFSVFLDTDVTNDPDSAANTAVSAEFAGVLVAKRFIGSAGLNSENKA